MTHPFTLDTAGLALIARIFDLVDKANSDQEFPLSADEQLIFTQMKLHINEARAKDQ